MTSPDDTSASGPAATSAGLLVDARDHLCVALGTTGLAAYPAGGPPPGRGCRGPSGTTSSSRTAVERSDDP
ncbi:hypothetical protein [Pseudonocardia sp.]|uniref:hypothetical protein n=1 Tax=Pseudonocardia sp. TaxID=60912 RepID=UPI0031FD12DA